MFEEIVESNIFRFTVLTERLNYRDTDFVVLVFRNFPTEGQLVFETVDEHPDDGHEVALDIEVLELVSFSELVFKVCIPIEVDTVFEPFFDESEHEILQMFNFAVGILFTLEWVEEVQNLEVAFKNFLEKEEFIFASFFNEFEDEDIQIVQIAGKTIILFIFRNHVIFFHHSHQTCLFFKDEFLNILIFLERDWIQNLTQESMNFLDSEAVFERAYIQ